MRLGILVKQLAWNLPAAGAQFVGQVLFVALLVACLGEVEGARALVVLWCALLLSSAAGLGLPEAGLRFGGLLAGRGRDAQARSLLAGFDRRQAAITSTVAIAVGAVAAPWDPGSAAVLVAGSLAAATEQRASNRAMALARVRALARARIAFHALRCAGLGAALLLEGGTFAVAAAIAIAAVAYPILVPLQHRPDDRAPPAVILRFARRYALGILAASIVATLAWTRVELLVLEWRSDSRETVLFAVALSLVGVIQFLPGVLAAPLLPFFAGRRRAGDRDWRMAYRGAIELALFASGLVAVAALAVTPWFVERAYGPDYAAAVDVTWLVAAAAIAGVGGITASLLHARGASRTHLWLTVAAAAVLGAGLWASVPDGGALAAAWVRAVVFLGYTAVLAVVAARRFGAGFPLGSLLRWTVIAALVAGGLRWWSQAYPTTEFGPAAIRTAAAIGAYLALSLALRPLGHGARRVVTAGERGSQIPGRVLGPFVRRPVPDRSAGSTPAPGDADR